jgi:RecB family exonuclease
VNLFGEVQPVQTKKPWYSPSRLKTFVECARKYEFAVVKKLPTPPQPHFDLGTNVHAALRDWLRLKPAQRTRENLVEFYRAAWRQNMPAFARRSRDELRDWGERGKAMILRYADEVAPDLEPVLIEKLVTADYGDVAVGGRVDRVDALPDGSLKVVDYKTGRYPKSPSRLKEEDLAAAVYARATSANFAGMPVTSVELHYLDGGETLEFVVDEAWQAHKDLAVVSAAHAAREAELAGAFPPQPSVLCRWCDFRARCPEGQAFVDGAGDAR